MQPDPRPDARQTTSCRFHVTRRAALPTGSCASLTRALYDKFPMAASTVTSVARSPAAGGAKALASARVLPGLAPPSRRPLGIAVVVGVMLLQLATDVVAGREVSRILAR